MSKQKNFHILKLEASNIKGIKAVVIEPEAGLVQVVGKNGQGKTSALDAIEMALRGKKFCPGQPIREGQEKGEITLELGDHVSKDVDLVIKRSFTTKGSYLKVSNGEGLEYKSAQSMLDALCGAMAFDPMEFTRMDAKKRSETLKSIAGLDFAPLEKSYKDYFDKRTVEKRSLKDIESQLKEYEGIEDVEVPDISEIQKKRNEAQDNNNLIDATEKDIAAYRSIAQQKTNRITELNAQIQKIQDEIARNLSEEKDHLATIDNLQLKYKEMKRIDLSSFDDSILSFGEMTQKKNKFNQKIGLQEKRDTSLSLINDMTSKLDDIKSSKQEMLSNASLPVDGLDFINGDVSYNGIEFEQVNTAEKIKISMAMAMALNPRLKVVRIMNGSLIDDDGMKQIKEMAEEKGFDIWVEKVSSEKDSANSFLITEGELSE